MYPLICQDRSHPVQEITEAIFYTYSWTNKGVDLRTSGSRFCWHKRGMSRHIIIWLHGTYPPQPSTPCYSQGTSQKLHTKMIVCVASTQVHILVVNSIDSLQWKGFIELYSTDKCNEKLRNFRTLRGQQEDLLRFLPFQLWNFLVMYNFYCAWNFRLYSISDVLGHSQKWQKVCYIHSIYQQWTHYSPTWLLMLQWYMRVLKTTWKQEHKNNMGISISVYQYISISVSRDESKVHC